MNKIFVSDYDGTLFQYGTVSQNDLETIQKFRKQGGYFGIATGRMINSIRKEIETYRIPVDFVIGVNGAVTVNHRFEELHAHDIDNEIGLKVRDYLRDHGAIHYSISDGYDVCNKGKKSPNLKDFDIPCHKIIKNNIKGLFSRMPSVEQARFVCEAINNTYGDHVKALPNYDYVDIASSKTDKAIALEKLLKKYNSFKVGTAGDAHNDLMMLQKYHGYVMKHGDETIVSQVKRKVNTVSEAIEDFIKI